MESLSLTIVHYLNQHFFLTETEGGVQEVEGPFRCNGGVKSITLDPKKKKSSQATSNLPILVPMLEIGMPTRIVRQIAPPFYEQNRVRDFVH